MSHKNSKLSPHVKALIKKGILQIPTSDSFTNVVEDLMNSWKLFHKQSFKQKTKYKFGLSGGYEYKTKSPESFDEKENFHVSLNYEPQVKYMSHLDKELLRKAKMLIKMSFPYVMQYASCFNEVTDLDVQTLFAKSLNDWQVRLLHYPPQPDSKGSEIIAASHVDKGFTIHFMEDAEGFQILWKGKWRNEKPWMLGYTMGYAGMNGQYYSKCNFPALCHRVKSTKKTREEGRNSIVMFIDFGDVTYDKKTYDKTQIRFPAGENYGMSFRRFKKFFTGIENRII